VSKLYSIWRKFSLGEISRKFLIQGDTEAYSRGLLECYNCIVTKEGTVRRRPGFRFVSLTAQAIINLGNYASLIKGTNYNNIHHLILQNYIFDATGHSASGNISGAAWNRDRVHVVDLPNIGGPGKFLLLSGPASGSNMWNLSYAEGDPNFTVTEWDTSQGRDDHLYIDGVVHQSRTYLIQKNTLLGDRRTKVRASEVGSYVNFNLGTSLDTEAIELDINAGEPAWINASRRSLVVGTGESEQALDADPAVITPTNPPVVDEQSTLGGSGIGTLKIGKSAVFFSEEMLNWNAQFSTNQKYAKSAYSFQYDWRKSGFDASEISYYASHLVGQGIFSPCITQNQYPIIWANKKDRDGFLSCTFDNINGIMAWSQHEIGGKDNGDSVVSLASSQAPTEWALWAVVNRLPPDQFGYTPYIEIYDPQDGEVYLDSYVKITGTDVNTVSVPHLADRTVSAVIDGMVHPDFTLDGNGDADLNFAGDEIFVGLKYTSRIETLPLDQGDPKNTARSFKKGWNRIYVGLFESIMPLINGKRPKSRTPQDNTGEATPLITDIIDIGDSGYTDAGTIVIEQDLPLPMEVTGIFADGGQSNL